MIKLTRIALAACALAVTAVPALGADLPPVYEPVPVPPAAFGGWYLRGDIGFSNQRVDSIYNVLYEEFGDVDTTTKDFDSAPIFGLGVGYRFNRWFRADLTGEYRGKSDFRGVDIASDPLFAEPGEFPDPFVDFYDGYKSEWLIMANAYVDLGTYWGITPFVGAGIGATRTTISDFVDVGSSSVPGSGGYADDESTWDLAWALHAGLAYEITPAFTLELAYRYLYLGDAESGDLVAFDGTNNFDNPMEFNDLSSHDVRVGFRYQVN